MRGKRWSFWPLVWVSFGLIVLGQGTTALGQSFLETRATYLGSPKKQGEALEARWDSFVSSPSSIIQSDQDLIFSAYSFREKIQGDYNYRWDLGGRYSNLEKFQFWVSEAFISQKFNAGRRGHLEFSFGRKFFSNLKIDSIWNLGVMESQFRGDPFFPIHQGLTGLFFNYKPHTKLQFKFFLSGLTFPDIGTNFDVQDGRVISNSPWYNDAPTHVEINGQLVPLTYDLNISNQYEKLLNFSAMAGVDWQEKGFSFSANIGVLPSNRWALNVRPIGVVTDSNQSQILASVNPQLLSRLVGSVGFSKQIGYDYSISAEYFAESYREDLTGLALQDDMQSDTFESSYLNVGLIKENLQIAKTISQVGVYYLRRLNEVPLRALNSFEYNDYNFDNAMSVQASTYYAPLGLRMNLRTFYDFTYKAILLSPMFEVEAQKNLLLYTRFDLAGSGNTLRSYIDDQKANDRLILGIRYAM